MGTLCPKGLKPSEISIFWTAMKQLLSNRHSECNMSNLLILTICVRVNLRFHMNAFTALCYWLLQYSSELSATCWGCLSVMFVLYTITWYKENWFYSCFCGNHVGNNFGCHWWIYWSRKLGLLFASKAEGVNSLYPQFVIGQWVYWGHRVCVGVPLWNSELHDEAMKK